MAVDVSTIALAVDSTTVVQAKTDLDNLVPSAAAVEKATDRVTTSSQGMTASFGQAANAATRARGDMSDAAAKYIAALEKEIATFGRTRAEIERVEAASLGFSKAERDKAAALGAAIDAMHSEEEAAKALAAQQDRSAAASAAFIARLKEQTATQGLSRAELLAHQAAQLGVTKEAAPLIAGLSDAGKEMEQFGFRTARSKTELLVLAHELSQGRYKQFGSSLMVLGEQTGVMSLAFSAAGLAAAGVVAAIAAVGVAAYKGYEQLETFNKSILLTGNYAGITAGAFDAMAKSIATSARTTLGSAQEALQGVIATGRFGPALLGPVSEAVTRMADLTGEKASKIIADFDKMADGVSRYAAEHNKSMHLISAAQYEQIKALEDAGKAEEAQGVYLGLLNNRLAEHEKSIGAIASAWRTAKSWISEYAQSWENIGKGSSVSRQLELAKERLADLEKSQASLFRFRDYTPDINDEKLKVKALQNSQELADGYAKVQAASDKRQQAGIEGAMAVKRLDEEIDKRDKATRKIEEYTVAVKKMRDAGDPMAPSAQKEAETIAAIRAKGDRGGPRAAKYNAGNPEDLDMQAAQKAIAEETALYGMRDRMLSAYHNARIIDDAAYYAGRQTAQDLYLEKTKEGYAKEFALLQSRMDGAKDGAERIKYQKQLVDAQAQYNKLLEGVAASGATDAIKRIGDAQKEAAKIAETAAKELQKRIDTEQKAVYAEQKTADQMGLTKRQIEMLSIARLEDAAATDAETLAAAKKTGAGDKEIEQLTKLVALDQKGIELKKQNLDASTRFATGAQTALNKYQDAAANSAAFTEKFINGSFSKMEDAIVNFTKTGKLNLGSLFQFMADEFIRQQARMLIAGNGSSGSSGIFGSLVSAAIGYFGGGSELSTSQYSKSGFSTGTNPNYGNEGGYHMAVGTNYVPYDGMKATLHEGEAVVPKKYNPAAGGAASGSAASTTNITINNNAPVKASAETSKRDDGGVDILVRIDEIVAASVANGGKTHDAIQQRFGLNAGGTTPRY